MNGTAIRKTVEIQRTYEDVEIFLANRNSVNIGDRIRVPALKVPATEIDGKEKMNFDEIEVDGEYATVYDKSKISLHLVFDRALFRSAVDYNNTRLWNNTQLAKYLRGAFLVELTKVLPVTNCELLHAEDLCGKNAKPFFKHGRNRVCFDKTELLSVWYWTETPVNEDVVCFCRASNTGGFNYDLADCPYWFVRPCFTIPILDISQLCAELYYEHALKEAKK